MKIILKLLKVVLKLLKPLISMGIFDEAIVEAISKLSEKYA